MIMATAITVPTYPRNVKLLSSKCVGSRVIALGLCALSYKPTSTFGHKLNSRCCFFCMPEPLLVNNFKRISWSVRSSVDNSGLDPSPTNGTTGTARLIRVIQAIQSKLGARIGEIRRGLPVKILFFLVGFYCSTAYATVIGQTGDWDILSAAFAVLIVEGIGALMYKASLPLLKKTKSLITKFNYWKAGLAMGLFLDSFKYEVKRVCIPLPGFIASLLGDFSQGTLKGQAFPLSSVLVVVCGHFVRSAAKGWLLSKQIKLCVSPADIKLMNDIVPTSLETLLINIR